MICIYVGFDSSPNDLAAEPSLGVLSDNWERNFCAPQMDIALFPGRASQLLQIVVMINEWTIHSDDDPGLETIRGVDC